MTPEDDIRGELERFEREVAAVHSALAGAIQREIGDPLDEASRSAVQEHARLVEASVGRRIDAYRAETVRNVLGPLHTRISELDIGQCMAHVWAEARRDLAQAVSSAPEVMTREEPLDTYVRQTGDSVLRRGGKLGVRTERSLAGGWHAARNLGRRLLRVAPVSAPARERRIPLRALLHRHAMTRLVAVQDELLKPIREQIARRLSHLERAMGDWTNAVVGGEVALRAAPSLAVADGNQPEDTAGSTALDTDEEAPSLDQAASAAEDLAAAIESLGTGGDLARPLEEALAGAVEASRTLLDQDLREVGTFMLREADLVASDGLLSAVGDATEREAQWIAWHRQTVDRLGLELHQGRVRTELLELLSTLDSDVVSTVVEPLRVMLADVSGRVTAVYKDVDVALQRSRAPRDGEDLTGLLTQARADLTDALETLIVARMDSDSLATSLRERADARVDEILALLQPLPDEVLVHRPVPATEPLDPNVKPTAIHLRQIAEQAYDAVLLERFRVATEPLEAVIDRVRSGIVQLGGVVRFNMDAALEELRGESPESDGGLDGARELALNGLDRTRATIDELQGAVLAAQAAFEERLLKAEALGWEKFHDRVRVDDRVQEQILDVGYRARSEVRKRAAALTVTCRRAAGWGMKWFRLGRKRAMTLVRLGQSALEGERVTEEQKRRTIDALSSLEDILGELPLVYRRLFSFQPVSDPDLLEGRAADIESVSQHFAQWRKGLTDAFVITGYDGNGRTSFLNVVSTTVLGEADVHRIRLTERILAEEVLANRLAEALGIGDGRDWTLDSLGSALLTQSHDAQRPLCCIVENLEHLFLRSSADNGLVGPFLAFLSRTDSSVFWIATFAEAAWNYIEQVEATTACLVRRHALTPFGRDALEAVIMSRHRRSGLRLEFKPAATPPPLLRSRLSRVRSEEQRQEVLSNDFFEQLVRLSGQNLLLALFYWVRSVHVDAQTSTVHVRPLDPISFAYIDAFTLSQSFTLKAFMDHATLTLAEHDRIFRTSRVESRYMFEYLGNLLVIEPAQSTERVSQFVFTAVDDQQRYRIRPLVVHPVLTHLRSKNIMR